MPAPTPGRIVAALMLITVAPFAGAPGAASADAGPGLPPTGFAVGQLLPEISLPSAEDGRPVSLAAYRGRKIVLHVFASW